MLVVLLGEVADRKWLLAAVRNVPEEHVLKEHSRAQEVRKCRRTKSVTLTATKILCTNSNQLRFEKPTQHIYAAFKPASK